MLLRVILVPHCGILSPGANDNKNGLFLEAAGSTILLDEIADIPVSLQVKRARGEFREDIPLLALHFFNIYVKKYRCANMELSKEALRCLERREWKGNVCGVFFVWQRNESTAPVIIYFQNTERE